MRFWIVWVKPTEVQTPNLILHFADNAGLILAQLFMSLLCKTRFTLLCRGKNPQQNAKGWEQPNHCKVSPLRQKVNQHQVKDLLSLVDATEICWKYTKRAIVWGCSRCQSFEDLWHAHGCGCVISCKAASSTRCSELTSNEKCHNHLGARRHTFLKTLSSPLKPFFSFSKHKDLQGMERPWKFNIYFG